METILHYYIHYFIFSRSFRNRGKKDNEKVQEEDQVNN